MQMNWKVEQESERLRAIQQVRALQRSYGQDLLDLACHAAFPLAVTADLLYCLRENFLPTLAWHRVADVIFSGLCESVGPDLYVMSGAVRQRLLELLLARFNQQRIEDLEELMGNYITERLQIEAQQHGDRSRQRAKKLGDRPHWTTLCCLKDGSVRHKIREELERINQDISDQERLYWIDMVESYAELLGEPILWEWARNIGTGADLQLEWTDWAAQYGIVLEPQTVLVGTIRFADESVPVSVDPNVLYEFEFPVVQLDRYGALVSKETGRASYFVEPLGDGVPPLELVAVRGGSFWMGSPKDELERKSWEGPQHEVTVPAFWMGKYPVTQAQWRFVAALPEVSQTLEADPSKFKGNLHPVERVSWFDAVEFCARLSVHTKRQYRLPSEAEWEYACRARTTTPFPFGTTITTDLANYRGTDAKEYDWSGSYGLGPKGEYRQTTTPIDQFRTPNAFGLCDMHGNVWEWCADHWHVSYKGAPTDGSAWLDETAESGASRMVRGGSWGYSPQYCRSAFRGNHVPRGTSDNDGFRVVCVAPSTL
jgi:formylglycine-generating enzyme required for sulfatase activity